MDSNFGFWSFNSLSATESVPEGRANDEASVVAEFLGPPGPGQLFTEALDDREHGLHSFQMIYGKLG